jgi:hypothetical protein
MNDCQSKKNFIYLVILLIYIYIFVYNITKNKKGNKL